MPLTETEQQALRKLAGEIVGSHYRAGSRDDLRAQATENALCGRLAQAINARVESFLDDEGLAP